MLKRPKKFVLTKAPVKSNVDNRYKLLIGDIKTIPYKLPPGKRWALETVRPPFSSMTMKQCRFPKEMHDCPRENVIIGMVYSQHHGVGPGHGATAWLCRNIAFDPYQRVRVANGITRRTMMKSPKPYFQFLGEFKAKTPAAAHDAWEAAVTALWDAYEELHEIDFYSAD